MRKPSEEILDHAVELDPAAREAYLRTACAGDAGLRAEIQDLLRVHDAFPEPAAEDTESRPGGAPRLSSPASTQDENPEIEGIGGFRFERELGRGGMGRVYLATEPGLGRTVAVKILPEHFRNDRDRVRRFEREARTLARLEHRNIATVYRFQSDGEQPFLVMEYVPGMTLRERLAAGAMSLDAILDVAGGVAEALATAHAAGVIHRDLKPSNVMVRDDGTVKLLDFGLAKTLEADAAGAESTIAGGLLGSPGYASPEQLRGDRAGPESDAWSFGCILYECLVGVPAFPGRTGADRMTAALTASPAWDALPEETPEYVRRLLGRTLEPDRAARISDFQEVAEILREQRVAGDRLPVPADAGRRTPSSKRFAWWLASVIAAGLVGVLVHRLVSQDSPHAGIVERQLTFGANARTPAMSADGKTVAYVADSGTLMLGDTDGGAPIVAFQAAEISRRLFWSPDGSEIFFSAREQPGAGNTQSFVVDRLGTDTRAIGPIGFVCSSISPDGRRLIGYTQNVHPLLSRLCLFDRASEDTTSIPLGPRFLRPPQVTWSPIADLLLFYGTESDGSRNAIWVRKISEPAGTRIAEGPSIGPPAWSPDGRSVLYRSDGKLMSLDIDDVTGAPSGEPRVIVHRFDAMSFSAADTPEGTCFAFESGSGTANLWWAEASSASWDEAPAWERLTRGTFDDDYCRLDPEGTHVAFVRRLERPEIHTLSLASGVGKQLTRSDRSKSWSAYSADGTRIAYAEAGVGVRVYDLRLGTATTVAHTRGASYVYWLAPERLLFKQSRDLEWGYWILDLETSVQTAVAPAHEGTLFHACPSPDGSAIAVAGNRKLGADLTTWIIDLDDRTERSLYDGWAAPIAWSPDAAWVYMISDDPALGGGIASVVFRVEVDSGRVAPLFECPGRVIRWGSISMSADVMRVVCAVTDLRSDIWVMEGVTL